MAHVLLAMISGRPSLKAPTATARPRAVAAGSQRPRAGMTLVDDSTLTNEVRRIMWEKVGIIRHGRDLDEAIRRLDSLSVEAKTHNSGTHFEAENYLEVARLIARCAAAREESRGVHYRVDFPLKQELAPPQHSYISMSSPVYFAP
jgi:aspartate oxidase